MPVVRALLLISGLMVSTAVVAIDVFRWVDADGVTHFADTPPAQVAVPVSTLDVPDSNPPDYDPATDPYSVLAQARRTREALAEQRTQAAQAAEQSQRALNVVVPPPPVNDTVLWYRPGRPPFYPPGHLPQPPPWPGVTPGPQLRALEQAGLTDRRSVSINSSRHAARVEASQALPVLALEPVPTPLPSQ